MIFKRTLLAACAVSAFAACTAVCVIAGTFALYALLRESLTPPAAAGGVALLAALVLAIGGLVATLKTRSRPRAKGAAPDGDLASRMIGLARERPMVAAAALLALGVIAVRNPKIVAATVGAFMAGKATPKS